MGSTSYSNLRENLAAIWDKVEDSQEPVIVERRGHQTMAILPAEELEGLRPDFLRRSNAPFADRPSQSRSRICARSWAWMERNSSQVWE